MILAHYNDAPVRKFDMSVHKGSPYRDGMKPNGLWVSVDDAEMNWQEWCVGENFRLDALRWRTPVTLKLTANILYIRSVEELDAFHAKHGYDILAGRPHKLPWPRTPRFDYLRWDQVIPNYDGIIITPYQWTRRLDGPMWYYAWDCASGCIWNGDAVELGEGLPFDIGGYAKSLEKESAA